MQKIDQKLIINLYYEICRENEQTEKKPLINKR